MTQRSFPAAILEGIVRTPLLIVLIVLVIGVQLVMASAIALGSDRIASIYTRDAAVLSMAATLLLFAAAFQVSDGIQVVSSASLRGLKDTRVPMLLAAFAYWGVGMPLGAGLGFGLGWGAPGMWVGLVAGLTFAALLLGLRLRHRLRRRPAGTHAGSAPAMSSGT